MESLPYEKFVQRLLGRKEEEGRMRFSPCQLLRGSSFSSEAGGESSLECGVAAQASRIQESESRIG
jgi:hypothetical protein